MSVPIWINGLAYLPAVEHEALAAELAEWKRMRNEMRDVAFANKAEMAKIEMALPHLLDFCLSPTFDAKGTYTQRKADEWAKRLTDFHAALVASAPETEVAK